jgi:hypothetical protein
MSRVVVEGSTTTMSRSVVDCNADQRNRSGDLTLQFLSFVLATLSLLRKRTETYNGEYRSPQCKNPIARRFHPAVLSSCC